MDNVRSFVIHVNDVAVFAIVVAAAVVRITTMNMLISSRRGWGLYRYHCIIVIVGIVITVVMVMSITIRSHFHVCIMIQGNIIVVIVVVS